MSLINELINEINEVKRAEWSSQFFNSFNLIKKKTFVSQNIPISKMYPWMFS